MARTSAPRYAAWLAQSRTSDSGAHRISGSRRPGPDPLAQAGKKVTTGQRRILLADADARNRESLRPTFAPLGADVIEAATGEELERTLLGAGPFHCVVASARLPEPSALQVLARVRRHGVHTPFIVVTSVHGNLLRIFVSDAEGTVLSSRMVDGSNLSMLVASLIATEAG